MPSRAASGPGRLLEILERLPLTPWWWLARWRNRDRQGWIRHVRNYY